MAVSIVKCDTYNEEEVRQALINALAPLGGLSFVKAGMKIVIKANLVSFLKPEAAATTHPVMLTELTKLLCEKGAEVIVGDSPGGLYDKNFVGKVYSVTGMKEVEKVGGKLNFDFSTQNIHFNDALKAKEFSCTSYLLDADAIINFCKLKTHGMMGLSAAAKNMFGVIPGVIKPEYHFKYKNPLDFANMIIDLNCYFKPTLCITDAVVGMEGNGPTAGTPRKIGAILASNNPHESDLLAATLIGLKLENVPTLMAAHQRNLVVQNVSELEIFGDYKPFVITDFKNIAGETNLQFGGDSLFKRIRGKIISVALSTKPILKAKECVGCSHCANICPAKAIKMVNKKPVIDRKKCIKCFCCQEFCPKGALKVGRTVISKILTKN